MAVAGVRDGMGTLVAVEHEDGVVLAADTRAVEGGTVRSDRVGRLFEISAAAAGGVGRQGDVDAFARALERAVDAYELERERDVGIDQLGRLASREAQDAGVRAAVAARDDDGHARVREVGPDGAVIESETVALGSGAETATGRLEGADDIPDREAAEQLARSAVEAAVERDVDTGGDIDVRHLSNR